METIFKFGTPILLDSPLTQILFLILPAVGAVIGAFLLQGTFMRIAGAAIGAVLRDILLILAVTNGLLEVTNPNWTIDFSLILAFFSGSAAAIMSCCSPYRGKLLYFNSAFGGFAGQFLLPLIMGVKLAKSKFDAWLLSLLMGN